MTRVGINGLGRIGRNLLKLSLDQKGIEVVRVNDIHPLESLVHLFKYDSIHGIFPGEVKLINEHSFSMAGREIEYSRIAKPGDIEWKNCELIVECSGQFKTRAELEPHLGSDVKNVILSVPPADSSIKMVVMGVNDHIIKADDSIVSNASCTTNSAAHLVNILNQNYELESCFITTIHSYTSDQNLLDNSHRDLRRARSAGQSIIPTSTGAAKALTNIFPELADVIGGCGIRVPVPNGSLTDLTFGIKNPPSASEVNALIKNAAENQLKGILKYSTEPLVSSDVIGNSHSCVFDSELTSVVGNMVKLVGWYDNEIGYSSRVLDLIRLIQSL